MICPVGVFMPTADQLVHPIPTSAGLKTQRPLTGCAVIVTCYGTNESGVS